MQYSMKKYYYTFLLIPLVGLITAWWSPSPGAVSGPDGLAGSGVGADGFVGSAACRSCHTNIYTAHLKTAHYRDSRTASAATIKGSFEEGRNHFVYNSHMDVLMEQKDGHFFQTAFFNGHPTESEEFGIVIGSGRKGQTYLFWDADRLYQLPVSYYSALNVWANSPNYPTNLVYFGKRAVGQCMECHTSYAKVTETPDRGAVIDSTSIVYGIDCERCHGPGARHVTWHTAHPGALTGRYIVDAKRLSRQQRLDACALCHSGFRKEFTPAFSFQVGDTLDNYSSAPYDTSATASLDVHGNQYGLLTASKCFRESDNLDCSSCHDPHADEYGKTVAFSARCVTCHNGNSGHSCSMPEVKKMIATVGSRASAVNCIDCHMPSLPSNTITFLVNDQDQPMHDLIRTHLVAIYPDIAKAYLQKIATRK
jgi:hypothetical protein